MSEVAPATSRRSGADEGGSAEPVILALLLTGLAAARFLLPFAPDRLFDVDPASVPGPLAALGPAASMWLDLLVLLVVGFTLQRESRRRGLDPWILGLGLLPLPVILLHARQDVLDAWRGFDWLAAALLAVALAHVVRVGEARRAAIAVLLGAVVVAGVRGVHQVGWEHAETVAFFDRHQAEILSARGWNPDSAAALAYERRLRQPEATGWVGFSNVFSGLAGAAALGLVGLLVLRRVDSPASDQSQPTARAEGAGGPVLLGLAGVGLAMLVGLNGSKGAILATGLGVATLALIVGPGRPLILRRPGLPVILVAVLTLVAVVARGLLGEDFAGERSLLFRWQYLQGAVGVFLAHPLFGVGPDGFQAAYLSHKPLTGPENVASAHAYSADWLATLGLSGAAWIGLLLLLPSRRRRPGEDEGIDAIQRRSRSAAGLAACVLVGAIGLLQFGVEHGVDATGAAVRLGGLAAGGLVGVVAWSVMGGLSARSIRLVALPPVVVLVAQAGIEMLLWQPGSVAICWAMVAAAATSRGIRSPGLRRGGLVVVSVTAVAVLAVALESTAIERRSEAAIRGLFQIEADGRATPEDRRSAADALAALIDTEGWFDSRPARGAVEQLMLAGGPADRQAGIELADRWYQRRPGAESAGLRAAVRVANVRVGEAAWEALAAVEDAIRFDPGSPRLRLARAELLASLGRMEEAKQEARYAVRLDQGRRLDPLVQFQPSELERVERLLGSDEAESPAE